MGVVPAVGIFGGRFDPPHLGHLALAREAKRALAIDELHVTVVADAAHKPSEASARDRLEMARLTFADLGAEIELEHHRYTVDALEAAGYDDPIFLVGADELAALPTWKEPERLLELAQLGVATRPGHDVGLRGPEAASPRIRVFEIQPHPISSSDLRERVRRGRPVDGLVVPAVAAYIAEHGLYRQD